MSGGGAGVMFGAGRCRADFGHSVERANIWADPARTLDACGVATPYRRRGKLVLTAAVLAARAHATYRNRFRGAYAPHRSGATVSTIHRDAIGVAYRPARPSRITSGLWTRARGVSRRSGQPESTRGRWTVGAPMARSCVAIAESRRRAPLDDAITGSSYA